MVRDSLTYPLYFICVAASSHCHCPAATAWRHTVPFSLARLALKWHLCSRFNRPDNLGMSLYTCQSALTSVNLLLKPRNKFILSQRRWHGCWHGCSPALDLVIHKDMRASNHAHNTQARSSNFKPRGVPVRVGKRLGRCKNCFGKSLNTVTARQHKAQRSSRRFLF